MSIFEVLIKFVIVVISFLLALHLFDGVVRREGTWRKKIYLGAGAILFLFITLVLLNTMEIW
jgi:hypothetical protein